MPLLRYTCTHVMDLERIKQNLRLRSGRSAKPKKKPRPNTEKPVDTALPNGTVPSPAKPPKEPISKPATGEQGKEEQKQEKSFDLYPETQADPPSEARPGLPHAATGLDKDNSKNKPSRQYGRSGMSIPHQPHNSSEAPPLQRAMTDSQGQNADSSDAMDFDLKAPAPKPRPPSVESLSELLFSAGHLNTILHDPREIARFTAFLNKFKPDYQPLILRYLETQKAIKAIEYANAVAEGATVASEGEDNAVEKAVPSVAATLDKAFEEASTASFAALVGTGLPMYITYCLTKLVSECLVNEITGKQTPMLRNLVGGLSEVFCLTDPTREDNPIIYASEEFYRYTGYGSDDVIGNNCRFLQGRKTSPLSPKRLRESIDKGEEICETLLNYRRDGRPFINLLLIAPLHDDKGKVKYFIGAQVDVTGLVEDGRGLDAFERYLAYRHFEKESKPNTDTESKKKRKALKKLRELSEMFDLEESAVVQTASRASSMSRESDASSTGSSERQRGGRRVLGEDDDSEQDEAEDDDDREAWKLGASGPYGLSGKLPGIYETYMLIRPAPSLRIIFVSPKLRKIGKVVQSPFLSHVAAPATTLAGLKESFTSGTPVSAKINFLPQAGESRDGTKTSPGKPQNGKNGRTCWISATPMLGADDRVGVWMIVVVEKTKIGRNARAAEVEAKAVSKAQANKPERIDLPKRQYSDRGRPNAPQLPKEELPIKPRRLDDSNEDVNGDVPSSPPRKEQNEDDNDSPTPRNAQNNAQNESQNSAVEANEAADDEDFVITRAPAKQEPSQNRVHVQPDSEGEPEPEEGNDWHPARSRSNTQNEPPEDNPTEERKYTPPPEIPDSMVGATPPPRTPGEKQLKLEDVNVDTDNDDEAGHELDATPTRTRVGPDDETISPEEVNAEVDEEKEEDEPDEGYGSPTRGPRGGGLRDSNMLTMDYLRHPGSQPVRSKKKKTGTDEDKWTDIDCMRSPYSVD